MALSQNTLLWIDLDASRSVDALRNLTSQYHIARVGCCNEIESAITSHVPTVLCFNFGTPHPEEMVALQAVKESHPSLPIIMLTSYHSEALALWALRARVWDYFVKPLNLLEFEATLKQLISVNHRGRKYSRRIHYPPQRTNTLYFACSKHGVRRKRTQASIDYVEKNYAGKITLNDVAKSCCLSQSAFSHLFHKENGMPFSEYLLRYRLDKASELLVTSGEAISGIAYAVGFNDASYFSRAFRRIHGKAPKSFRTTIYAK